MARNSYYDGTSGDDVVVGGSIGQAVLIDERISTASSHASTATTQAGIATSKATIATANAISAAASAAAALASRNSVENIIPTGGDVDSILTKSSSSDYALEWTNTIDAANVDGGYF